MELPLAREMLRKAIDVDPELAIAYAWMALVDLSDRSFEGSMESRERLLASALKNARRAIELDEDDARCHVIIGFVYLRARELDKSEYHHDRASALNPSDAHIAAHMGLLTAYLGNPDGARRWFRRAFALNPYPPSWYRDFLGIAQYIAHDYPGAVASLNPTSAPYPWDRMYAIAACAQLGRKDEARAQLLDWHRFVPNGSILEIASLEPFKDPAELAHLLDGLRKAISFQQATRRDDN